MVLLTVVAIMAKHVATTDDGVDDDDDDLSVVSA